MSASEIHWLRSSDPAEAFPRADRALDDPDGLLAAGGDLSEARILYAYRHGIFPWYDEGQPILWWSPNPRTILGPGDYHCSRSLRRHMRKCGWRIRFNTDFEAVLQCCAAPRPGQPGTWITPEMSAAYSALHRSGWAHSVEVFRDETLIGGAYGLAIGRVFFGESMFSRAPDASKMALFALQDTLWRRDFGLFDCQVVSGHLLSLGARQIARDRFLSKLETLCTPATTTGNWPADAPIRSYLT